MKTKNKKSKSSSKRISGLHFFKANKAKKSEKRMRVLLTQERGWSDNGTNINFPGAFSVIIILHILAFFALMSYVFMGRDKKVSKKEKKVEVVESLSFKEKKSPEPTKFTKPKTAYNAADLAPAVISDGRQSLQSPNTNGSLIAYHIQLGDSLRQIAESRGISAKQLLRLNNLDMSSISGLRVGDRLWVPKLNVGVAKKEAKIELGRRQQQRSARRFYTIRRGDTLSRISRKYGVSVAEIRRMNGGVNPRRLIPGKKIALP